jgi:hypothetical protein
MSYQVADRAEPHRSSTATGAGRDAGPRNGCHSERRRGNAVLPAEGHGPASRSEGWFYMSGMRGILGIPPRRLMLLAQRAELKGTGFSGRGVSRAAVPLFIQARGERKRPGRAGCQACPLMPLM